ncbi:hypothetical protein ACIBG4_31855 [Nonomuraea sp. NPDC050383]|uniref:hypothetical protein n=1 Tax=Nonomuraea sp. NPDC050383 TaxID=3364362 RepID=UPI0037B6AEB0
MAEEESTGAKERYITAATVAAGASLIIRRPLAFSIAAMLAAMICDPDDFAKAVNAWKTRVAGGVTDELDKVKEDIPKLLDYLKKEVKWEGETFQMVEKVMADFVTECENDAKQRDGVGDGCRSAKDLYNALSYVAAAVGGLMVAWAAFMAVATVSLWGRAAAEVAVTPALGQTANTTRGAMTKALMFAGALSMLFMGVTQLSAKQQAKLQQLQASADFSQLGLGNDKATGMLTPKVIMGDQMKKMMGGSGTGTGAGAGMAT